VPASSSPEPVRAFGPFTPDLHALADWLIACGIDTVAMESTGVYWIPIFEVLEARGLNVYLVNSWHLKHVPGRTHGPPWPAARDMGRVTCWIASGFNNCTVWACCVARFGPMPRCARYAACSVIAPR
jgi:hypothetical protein